MKARMLLGVFLAPCLLFGSVGASDVAFKRSEFQITPEISSYKYQEPSCMAITGIKYGVSTQWFFRAKPGGSFALCPQFRFMTGRAVYDGRSLSRDTRIKNDVNKDYYLEGRILLGFVVQSKRGKSGGFCYVGCGARYLFNRIEDYYRFAGWDRQSSYMYLPIGILLRANTDSGWFFEANPELDIMVKGWQVNDSYFYKLKFTNTQHSGYGLRLSCKVGRKVGSSTSIFIEPFVRYWSIGESDGIIEAAPKLNTDHWYEPKNNTAEYGIKVGVGITF